MLAMTGVITATTKKHSLITILQDIEYIHGQLFERTVESGCGSVTCLPGALTMLRFSAFRRMAKYYFADKAEQCEDLFDYGKCHLGEDRWLTHLFMIGAKKRFQIQMCTSAFCKTEAVQTYKSLIKQRRRWFLGFITNEACMLTDVRIWKRYPILALVRFMQNTIRTTALLFFILLLAVITTSKQVANLPISFIAISLGLNWLMMIYFGLKLKRFKTWLYPLMFVINPFFNWYYMVYGIFTAGQRTWGGPRADAGSADANTTPQQAIEMAKATGDELNVVPETFKAASDTHRSVHLLPPERLEGRFAAPQRHPGGWYQQGNDSTATVQDIVPTTHHPRPTLHHRDSFDSFVSAQSGTASVYMPRRVESIMGEEDRKRYAMAQANQRAAGGAYMTVASQPGHTDEISDAKYQKAHWSKSAESLGSYHSRATYQRVPSCNSITSGKRTPEAMSMSETETISHGVSNLAIPQPALNRRYSSRNGGSPLAQNSLVRTATVDGLSIEMQEQNGGFVEGREESSAMTAPGENPRGRLRSRSSSR
jgi:chitin synthase